MIHKVRNTTDLPLAEGIVRVYQDDLFQGSDFIETTPVGSEGSVTIGSLPDGACAARKPRVSESPDGGRSLPVPGDAGDHELQRGRSGAAVLDQRVPYAWDFVFGRAGRGAG